MTWIFGSQAPASAVRLSNGPNGSDSPLFDLPRQDSGPDSSATHAGLPVGVHRGGFRGSAATSPLQLFSTKDELIPGLTAQPSLQEWQDGSGTQSRASSPDSDLPPGLGPDDVATALADEKLQAVLHRARQPQSDLIEAVHIPGIGTTSVEPAQQPGKNAALDPSQRRELSRSPILSGFAPATAIHHSNSSNSLNQQRPLSGSGLTSLPNGAHQNGNSAAMLALSNQDVLHPPQASDHAAAQQYGQQNGGGVMQGFAAHSVPQVAQNGLIPVRPGAVPTEPVQSDGAYRATHAPSHAANGSWQDKEQQRVEAQASWQDLGADVAEVERQAATFARPRSAQGRPQQPIQDLSLLGDSVDVLLQYVSHP